MIPLSKRCLPDKSRFGFYDKREDGLLLICTPDEKRIWKEVFGAYLASFVRTSLDERAARNHQISIWKPPRPPLVLLTERVHIRVGSGELYYWQTSAALRGTQSYLGRTVCILLNREVKRRQST